MSRKERRSLGLGLHVKGTGRAPGKTGQPSWFVEMKIKEEQKRAEVRYWKMARRTLSQVPLSELVRYEVLRQKQADALTAAGCETIWDLVSANYTRLCAVNGFGTKTLAKLKQDLALKVQVRVQWSVSQVGR